MTTPGRRGSFGRDVDPDIVRHDDITSNTDATSIKRDRGGRVVIGGKPGGAPRTCRLVNRDLG